MLNYAIETVIMISSNSTDSIASMLSIKINAGIANQVTSLPLIEDNSFIVEKNIYSGKAK